MRDARQHQANDAAAVFLASDDSDMMTGTDLRIDGGAVPGLESRARKRLTPLPIYARLRRGRRHRTLSLDRELPIVRA
jgi:hypothetical protein